MEFMNTGVLAIRISFFFSVKYANCMIFYKSNYNFKSYSLISFMFHQFRDRNDNYLMIVK